MALAAPVGERPVVGLVGAAEGERINDAVALKQGERATVRVGSQPSLLATLPESTFFTRYAATFGR